MTTETLHQGIAILRRIRGLSIPVGSDYGHAEIAELAKEALELLEKAEDKDEVFRLRRLNENQAKALEHWRRLSDVDAARIRDLEAARVTVENERNERTKSLGYMRLTMHEMEAEIERLKGQIGNTLAT